MDGDSSFYIILWLILVVPILIIASIINNAKRKEQERLRKERKERNAEMRKEIREQDKEFRKILNDVKKTKEAMFKAKFEAMAKEGLAKIQSKGAAWHKAMEQAQKEFREAGIEDLSFQNKDLIKRADELYDSGAFANFEKEIYPTMIKNAEEMAMKSLPGKTHGGYKFSLAQLDTVKGLQKGQLVTIGKIMVEAKTTQKRSYQIKQDLFYAIPNWDMEFFVQLASADSYFAEKDIIFNFYNEFEYDTEEEAIATIEQSEYLNHYPELKKAILENALR